MIVSSPLRQRGRRRSRYRLVVAALLRPAAAIAIAAVAIEVVRQPAMAAAAAAAESSPSSSNKKSNFKSQYQFDDGPLSSSSSSSVFNPLWRETHVFTGEQCGPLCHSDVSGVGVDKNRDVQPGRRAPTTTTRDGGVKSRRRCDVVDGDSDSDHDGNDDDKCIIPPLLEDFVLPSRSSSSRGTTTTSASRYNGQQLNQHQQRYRRQKKKFLFSPESLSRDIGRGGQRVASGTLSSLSMLWSNVNVFIDSMMNTRNEKRIIQQEQRPRGIVRRDKIDKDDLCCADDKTNEQENGCYDSNRQISLPPTASTNSRRTTPSVSASHDTRTSVVVAGITNRQRSSMDRRQNLRQRHAVHLSGGGICHSSPSSPSSRGRFSIDLFDPTATPAKISIPLSSPRTAGKLKPSVQTTLSSNVESITSETSTISAAEEREDGPHGPAATSSSQTNKIHQRGQSSSVLGDDDNLHKDNGNFQMSLSVDPLSSARLVRQLLTVVLTSTSAFVGTLKLIAPMIVARRCLNIILFVFYDHYNGRYIRTTYTKRMQHLQRFEVLAALRSAGRIALQSLALGIAGGIISSLMDVAPCFIQPLWMCSAWHACVWVATVYVLEWFTQTWLIVQVRHPLIKIRPTQTVSTLTHHQRRRSRNRNKSNRGLRCDKSMMPGPTPTTTLRSTLTEIPQLILHRLEDPEEWVDSMLRPILGGGQYARYYTSTNDDNPRSMRYGRRTTKLDTLLFPSTWTPLRLLLSLAVGFAIFNTYESHGSGIGGPKSRTLRRLVMRSFVFQEVIHSEWLRVFVHERRIALGAVFSIVDLVAYIAVMVPIVAVSGPIGALLLFPPLIARLVSGWMNFLLYHDRYFGGPVPGFTIRHWPFVRNDS